MKKTVWLFALVALFSTQAFATYIVVLKDGTRYKAKTRWTTTGTKARVSLENGQTLLLNLSDIDVAKSDEITRLGLGSVSNLGTEIQAAPPEKPKQSLGDAIRLRPRGEFGGNTTVTPPAPAQRPQSTAPVAAPVADQLDARLKDKFERAYENTGIFEHTLTGTNRTVRAELTADSEDKVFNALSATAFLVVRNAGLDNVQIDMVELFMKTTNGGTAGRFQMSRADAEQINTKTNALQDYFVRNVIY